MKRSKGWPRVGKSRGAKRAALSLRAISETPAQNQHHHLGLMRGSQRPWARNGEEGGVEASERRDVEASFDV